MDAGSPDPKSCKNSSGIRSNSPYSYGIYRHTAAWDSSSVCVDVITDYNPGYAVPAKYDDINRRRWLFKSRLGVEWPVGGECGCAAESFSTEDNSVQCRS